MLFLLACTDPPIYCIDGSVLGPEGCPEVDTGAEEAAAPLLTAQEALDDLADLLTLGIPEARTPGEVYQDLVSHIDEDCPGQDGGATFALLAPCTTAEGYTFSGVSSWQHGVHGLDGYTEYVFTSYQTSMTAATPGGETFTIGGIIGFGALFFDDGTTEASSWLAGTVHYPPSESWLAENTSSDMHVAVTPQDDGGSVMTLEGGYAIGERAAYFDTLTWQDGCATGGLRARDLEGGWYALTLSDCSGCGPVTVAGLDHGEGCIDLDAPLSALHDVMVAPL